MATQTRSQWQPVQERFQAMPPEQFGAEIDRLWDAAGNIVDVVKRLVQNDDLKPHEGVGILACATGSLFGYQQFHGQASPADLARSLQDQIR